MERRHFTAYGFTARCTNNGWTAVFSASLQGHLDVVNLLLGAKEINVNQADSDGRTALFSA